MEQPAEKEHAQAVRKLFSRIAPHYDFMNRLMTGGQDMRWRREVIRRAGLKAGTFLLDVGSGTGDLAREARRQQPAAHVFAADFTLEMMRAGKQHGSSNWTVADALALPYANDTFEAAVSGFFVRNVANLERALSEQFRVLKNGGRIVILDTTRPQHNLFTPLIWVHMHILIPLIGGLFAGSREAYTYLPDSTENFLPAEGLAERMTSAGFINVGFRRRMFGTIAIHWGEKEL